MNLSIVSTVFDTAVAALTTDQMIVLTAITMETNKPMREVHIDALPYFLASSIWLSSAALDDTTEKYIKPRMHSSTMRINQLQWPPPHVSTAGDSGSRGGVYPTPGGRHLLRQTPFRCRPPPLLKTLPSL